MSAHEDKPVVLTDAVGTAHAPASGPLRIVSLVPSLTELVCDLGLTASLVGRTGFCVHPREALRTVTKVGGTKDVRIDTIRALDPTHVIVNVDENRRDSVAALAEFVPNVIVTHPCRPEDNFALYRLFGHVFGCEAGAEQLTAALAAALERTRAVAARLPPERVLYLIWRAPWMTVARDTYIATMLAQVGWHTLPPDAAVRYPLVDWQSPWRDTLDRVLLSTEPYRFRQRNVAEVAALAERPVSLIDGQMTSWYGSRAIAGLQYLADLRVALDGSPAPLA
jgi:ABC-type Fe3+-hydroxamate transport system substrate-binding protein